MSKSLHWLNKLFLYFTIPPDSNIPLPLCHVYLYASEHSVILWVSIKELILGDVKLGMKIQKILIS